jgi:hypothetical protein
VAHMPEDYLASTRDVYLKALYGAHAVELPLNFIFQCPAPGVLVGVVQSQPGPEVMNKLLFGSNVGKLHQLVLTTAVLQPRLVMESTHLLGSGISGLARSGFDPDGWLTKGKIIHKTE